VSTVEGGANIIQSGLVFCFDPANNKSFVVGSTTANDLKNNTLLTFKNKQYFGGTGDIVTVISPTYDSNNKGSIYFNGVSVLTGDGLYLPTGDTSTNISSNVTLSNWFKKTSYNNSYVECPAAKGYNSPGPGQPFTFYLLNNLLYGRITTTTSGGITDISTTFNLNVWNNAVLTYDGSNMKLYLNGVLKSSTPKTGPLMNITAPFNIGCQFNGGYFPSTAPAKTSEFFKGYISNTLVYDRALNDSEVLQNYNTLKSRFGLS
jgi:hypothetical protein